MGKINTDNRDYIIYTDYVSDDKDIYRLFVDMVNGDSYITLSDTSKEIILDKYRKEIKNYINSL